MAKIAYGYCRASDASRHKGNVSLDTQASAIRAFCAANGYSLADLAEDDDTSGGTLMRRRPNGKGLLSACLADGAVLIVEDFSRGFRSLLDFCVTVAELHTAGGTLVATTMPIDLTSYPQYMAAAVTVAASEMMRIQVGQFNRSRRATRRAAGQRIAGDAPYGFRYERTGVMRDDGTFDEVLRPAPEELDKIRQVLDWTSHGKSAGYIATRLNLDNVPTRRGGPWVKASVRTLVVHGRERLKKARAMGVDGMGLGEAD